MKLSKWFKNYLILAIVVVGSVFKCASIGFLIKRSTVLKRSHRVSVFSKINGKSSVTESSAGTLKNIAHTGFKRIDNPDDSFTGDVLTITHQA
jgi:hypothetical protein